MDNNVILSDDEIAVIVTSLKITILGYEKHILLHGESKLDSQTKQAYEEMKALQQRLVSEYF